MPPCLPELKVTPSFCFPFKIPDDPTAITKQSFYQLYFLKTDLIFVGSYPNQRKWLLTANTYISNWFHSAMQLINETP